MSTNTNLECTKVQLAAQRKHEYRLRTKAGRKVYDAARYQKNKEAVIMKQALRRQTHAQHIKEQDLIYRSLHKKEIAETNSKYREENKESIGARQSQWYQDNKEHVAEQRRLYLASERGRIVNNEGGARRKARKRTQICGCCVPKDIQPLYAEASKQGMHVDHIKPLSKGGLHCLDNLQLLTPYDNLSKAAKYAS